MKPERLSRIEFGCEGAVDGNLVALLVNTHASLLVEVTHPGRRQLRQETGRSILKVH